MVKQLESVAAKQLKLLAHSDRKIEKLEKQISHYKCEVKYNGHVIDSSDIMTNISHAVKCS